jgi:hypothetical protein
VFLRGFEHKACAERTFDLKEAQMTVSEMLRTHPKGSAEEALARCVEECFACAAICTACADACLGEQTVANLVRCIRTDLDCADICAATGSILARQTERDAEIVRSLLQSCVVACRRCAEECEAHAEHHEHCRICAEACRRCEQACANMLG